MMDNMDDPEGSDLDSDIDEFEDAEEDLPAPPSSMDFSQSLDDAMTAVHLFFNNNFIEARKMLQPWAKTSMYHALGNGVFDFLEAILTFEHENIQKASETLRQALSVCNKYRHKSGIGRTIGKIVKRPNYDSYTIEQVHAELCFAEGLLLKALLTVIEDETLVSLVKASLNIRSCFNMYKTCNCILKTRKWTDEKSKIHFEGGVRMGIGTFNVMISLLPSRAIKLLEFIGFSGSKDLGLRELEKGYSLKHSIRQVLSVMTLLAYHLIVVYVLSHRDGDLELCESIVKEQLRLYPKGVWFLFYKARLELMKGNVDEAETWYVKSWKSQDLWPQFHHLCFWELMWASAMKGKWLKASECADKLVKESKWSRTIYSYQKASLLLMLGDALTPEQIVIIEELMRTAPNYKQRIAGKSLPMEKFVIKRSARYFSQKKWLCLPSIELMYLWNFFKPLSKNSFLFLNMLKLIEQTQERLPDHREYDHDNRLLLRLLKGCVLRHMNMFLQAEENFLYIIDNARKLKEDTFLVPYAVFEMALVNIEQKNYAKAGEYLESAKKNYTGYSLESRLHFRIHSAHNLLQELLSGT